MAYYCRTCRIVFERKYSNCHICGYGLQSDDRSVQEYVDMGYELAGKARPGVSCPQIEDGDVLSTLRNGYRKEFRQNHRNTSPETNVENQAELPAEDQDFFAATGGGTSRADRRERVPDRMAPSDENFFAREHRPAIRVSQEITRHEEGAEDAEILQLDPVRLPRNSGVSVGNLWYGFLNVMRGIPWATVFRVVLIGLLIWGLVSLWNARFLIWNSILGFISALVPTALTIILVVYLIRYLFR